MLQMRIHTLLLATSMLAAPAIAKDETLADRGRRMCDEVGIALSDCTILPPKDRVDPQTEIVQATPSSRSLASAVPFGTGKYGWCADCTSLFGAAPVEPWGMFGGRAFTPARDEDDRTSVADAGATSGGGTGGGNTSGGGNAGGTGSSNTAGTGGTGGGTGGDTDDGGSNGDTGGGDRGDRGSKGDAGGGGGKGDTGNKGKW